MPSGSLTYSVNHHLIIFPLCGCIYLVQMTLQYYAVYPGEVIH